MAIEDDRAAIADRGGSEPRDGTSNDAAADGDAALWRLQMQFHRCAWKKARGTLDERAVDRDVHQRHLFAGPYSRRHDAVFVDVPASSRAAPICVHVAH